MKFCLRWIFRQPKGFLAFNKFNHDSGHLIQLHIKSRLLCSSMLRELEGKVHIRGSHQVQCLRQAIRKPQLAKCNPVSISHPISLGLKLFYSIHPHSWCWAHALPALYHLFCLVPFCSDSTVPLLPYLPFCFPQFQFTQAQL